MIEFEIGLQEVGWDSEKVGYDGLIDVANRLMVAKSNSETKDAAVCVKLLKLFFLVFIILVKIELIVNPNLRILILFCLC